MTPNSERSNCPPSFWCLLLFVLLLPAPGCAAAGGSPPPPPPAVAPGEDEDTWAIRCLTLRGTDRFEVAKRYTEALQNVKGLKADLVQAIHEENESSIYYGRYRRRYNARTDTESFRPDHLRDLDLIRHLSLTIQDPAVGPRPIWPFQMATMDTLPAGRATHPEWLLTKASGYYSLQVAVFYNTEEMRRRKYAAEEYCKLLRSEGREAYYHHGPVNSSVCVGTFPKDAIQTSQSQDPYTGIIRVQVRMVDQELLALQKEFPHNLHNGRTFYEVTRDPKTGQKIRDPHTSFAVEIPRAGKTGNAFAE